jgi:hypothetical protein
MGQSAKNVRLTLLDWCSALAERTLNMVFASKGSEYGTPGSGAS